MKFFSLLNNYSLRPGRKVTARAWSIWILPARAVHFPARADTPGTGPALRLSFNAGLDDLNFPFESLFVSKWIQHEYENASKLGNGL